MELAVNHYKVEIDQRNNRLYLAMAGVFSEEQAAACANEIESAVERLQPGFDVINDISGIKPQPPEALVHADRAYRCIARNQVCRVIRVVTDVPIDTLKWAAQMERSSRGAGYTTDIATSIAEAEKLLSKR
jgi:hypothetical protein